MFILTAGLGQRQGASPRPHAPERPLMARIRVGILGATGTVGQRFVQLLDGHPQFTVTALAASERSREKPYGETCACRPPGDMPVAARTLMVRGPEPPLDCDVVFSSLPAEVAGPIETRFAAAGYPVLSNSSSHRMDEAVPLLIPEVNAEHLTLLDPGRGTGGGVNRRHPQRPEW